MNQCHYTISINELDCLDTDAVLDALMVITVHSNKNKYSFFVLVQLKSVFDGINVIMISFLSGP